MGLQIAAFPNLPAIWIDLSVGIATFIMWHMGKHRTA
jgi:hypothetical protein